MKKVLFIILASFMSFGNAQAIEPSFTVGLGMTQSVFAATGKEDNYNETGGGMVSTEEYGAFEDAYPSLIVEVGLNDVISLGGAVQGDFSTPRNVNERGGAAGGKTNATSSVQVDFKNYVQAYVKLNVPLGGTYIKAGIARADANTSETQASGNSYPDADLDGYLFAIGYQHDAAEGLGVRLEIQGHSFDDITVNNGKAKTANFNQITISDMIGASASLSLVKSF